LIQAAATVFAEKGVAGTSVDDIVRTAGVAKGTFYLYFATKDHAVNAVAARMVEGVADRIEAVAADPDRSPVERLIAFGAEVRAVGDEPFERDLVEVFHRPENRALHDRMSEGAIVRLTPVVAAIIADGIDRGLFHGLDPARASAFVMACFGTLHEIVSDPGDVPDAVAELNGFVLRGLGYDGPVPA
jgi:AcrR family transcriptional regulator